MKKQKNLTMQRLLLRPFRSQKELQQLLDHLSQFKQFRALNDVANLEEVLIDIQGIFLPKESWLYQEGEQNDDMVYFLIQGEVEKCNQKKKLGQLLQQQSDDGLQLFITEGEFFGCYNDESRIESVRCVRDSLLLKINRTQFKQLVGKQKEVANTKVNLIKSTFPKLDQVGTSGELMVLASYGTIVKYNENDLVIVSKSSITNQLNKEEMISDTNESNVGFMILLDGICDLSVEIDISAKLEQSQISTKLPQTSADIKTQLRLCTVEKQAIIGEETLLTQKQWSQIQKQLPFPFSKQKKLNERIDHQYHVKVVSKTAKFLCFKKDDMDKFPDYVLEQFIQSTKQTNIQRMLKIKKFCSQYIEKKPDQKQMSNKQRRYRERESPSSNQQEQSRQLNNLQSQTTSSQYKQQRLARSLSEKKVPESIKKSLPQMQILKTEQNLDQQIKTKQRVISLQDKGKTHSQVLVQSNAHQKIKQYIQQCRNNQTLFEENNGQIPYLNGRNNLINNYQLQPQAQAQERNIEIENSLSKQEYNFVTGAQGDESVEITCPRNEKVNSQGKSCRLTNERIIESLFKKVYDFGELQVERKNVRNQLIKQGYYSKQNLMQQNFQVKQVKVTKVCDSQNDSKDLYGLPFIIKSIGLKSLSPQLNKLPVSQSPQNFHNIGITKETHQVDFMVPSKIFNTKIVKDISDRFLIVQGKKQPFTKIQKRPQMINQVYSPRNYVQKKVSIQDLLAKVQQQRNNS